MNHPREQQLLKKMKSRRGIVELTIEPIAGEPFNVDAHLLGTIRDLKDNIWMVTGIEAEQQHLVWRSNVELEDDNTLKSYGLDDGHTIRLIPAMRGGPISLKYVQQHSRQPAEDLSDLSDDLADMLATMGAAEEEANSNGKKALFVILFGNDGRLFHIIRMVDESSSASSSSSSILESRSSVQAAELITKTSTRPKRKSRRSIENEATHQKMLALRHDMENKNELKKLRKSPPQAAAITSTSSVSFPPRFARSNSRIDLTSGRNNSFLPRIPVHFDDRTSSTEVELSASPMQSKSNSYDLSSNSYGTDQFLVETRQNSVIRLECEPVSSSRSSSFRVNLERPNVSVERPDTPPPPMMTSRLRLPPIPLRGSTPVASLTTEQTTVETVVDRERMTTTVSPRPRAISLSNVDDLTHSSCSLRMTLSHALSSTINAVLNGGTGEEGRQRDSYSSRKSAKRGGRVGGSSYMLLASSEKLSPLAGRQLSSSTLKRSVHNVLAEASQLDSASSRSPANPAHAPANRCAVCRKKTGLTTSFECRCGSTFCAIHRFPEEHKCAIDYRAEGRTTTRNQNPVVKAPKLPKM